MTLRQYGRFLLVGAVVAVVGVLARELFARMLHADTMFYYSLSIVCAYVVGILLSFCLNSRFTFNDASGRLWKKLLIFAAIALLGLLSTWLLALELRYGLGLEEVAGRYSATIAFALAAAISSAITYPLNAALVFPRRDQQVT